MEGVEGQNVKTLFDVRFHLPALTPDVTGFEPVLRP
jgi:hypothetical protein